MYVCVQHNWEKAYARLSQWISVYVLWAPMYCLHTVLHRHSLLCTHTHTHSLIRLVQMKQYLEAGVIRANSIGLWYFIIHLPTTPAIDSHIFLLHFVFSLINGAELMKMALSGLAYCWRTAFMLHGLHDCICVHICVGVRLWTFHPWGLSHTVQTHTQTQAVCTTTHSKAHWGNIW